MSDEITGKLLTYVEVDVDVYRATIFENEPIAAGLPRNWSLPLSTVVSVSIVADVNAPSGRAIRTQKSAGNRSLVRWDAPPAIRDVSSVGLFRTNVAGLTNMGIGLRVSGTDGAENGYFLRLGGDALIELFKFVAGAATSLATFAFPHGEGENLWLRFDALDVVGGVLLRGKAWRGSVSDEPESFSISSTETVSVFETGSHGLLVTSSNAPDSICGMFRVRSMFSQSVETLRFAKSAAYLPDDIQAMPSLLEVQVSPGAISLGENLGERASVTAAFKDHRHADLGEMYERGTFWGKFRGRELFRRGEPVRIIRGLLGQTLAQMETRHYVLDNFSGPSFGGAFQFVGKDPLKLADDDRALAPRPNNGFLVTSVLAAATTLTLSPGGIGAAEYPFDGYAAIGGKEIVQFNRGGNDSFTKALLHLDGADASTTITDNNAGGAAHTWTVAGNAQIDIADSKFGGASLLCDGTGDWVSTLDHADFTISAGIFTVDFWFKSNAAGGSFEFLCGQCDSTPTAASTAWRVDRSNANVIVASVFVGASARTISGTTQFTNAVNMGWHHCAFVGDGVNIKLFIDGVQEGLTTAISGVINDSSNNLRVGALGEYVNDPWTGWLDEFRLSVGVARWTSNFTPPIGPYDLGDVMQIVRGQFNTTAINHSAEDRVQSCLLYTARTPAAIIGDLLIAYAGVPPAYVPLSNWEVECDTFLDRLYTKVVAEPTGVQELVSNLIKQAGLALWWDAVTQQIRLQVLRGVATDAFRYDQGNVLAGSISVEEQPEKRVTQCWTYYGVRNPLEPLDHAENYRSGLITVDLETETLHGGAVIRTIFADWIPAFGRQTAQRINDLQIGRFRTPPRRASFDVFRYSGVSEPQLGGGYRLNYWGAQSEFGDEVDIPIQVTRLNPMADRIRVEAEEMLFTQLAAADLVNRSIVFDSNVNNVNLRSVHDSIYPVPTDADVVAGVNLTVIVSSGVTVGSSSVLSRAFDVGSWPSGFPIVVQVKANGRIQGAGGKGGDGGLGGPGGTGQNGSVALFTRKAISLDLSAGGKTQGGGGGGGGGGGAGDFTRAANGGGGAGKEPGLAGLAGSQTAIVGQPGTQDAGGLGGDFDNDEDDFGNGGNGGGPGLSGQNGTAHTYSGGVGGSPGAAIDGVSFVTVTLGSGVISGPQIN